MSDVRECPACVQPLEAGVTRCPGCGLELAPLHALGAAREELERLEQDQRRVGARLEDMRFRLDAAQHALVEAHRDGGADGGGDVAASAPVEPPPATATDTARPPSAPAQPPPLHPRRAAEQKARRLALRRPEAASGQTARAELEIGQRWLLVAGIGATLLGVAFFLKYSFERGWFGPAARVAIAYGSGLFSVLLGERLRARALRGFGLALVGAGVVALYFATFAAFQLYGLVGAPLAFALMCGTTALAGALALAHDAQGLAVLGLVGGFATPALLSTGIDNHQALFGYMLVLNAGVLTLSFFRQWRWLDHLGFICTWALFSSWSVAHYEEAKWLATLVASQLFFLVYAVTPFAWFLLRERGGRLPGIALTAPNAALGFGFAYWLITEVTARSAAATPALAYAALFALMALYLYGRDRRVSGPIVLLVAEAAVFFVLAVPLLVSGTWMTLFWAAQGLAFTWAATRLGHRGLYMAAGAFLVLVVGKLSFFDLEMHFGFSSPEVLFEGGWRALAAQRFLVEGGVLATLLGAAWLGRRAGRREALEGVTGAVFGGLFAALLLGLLSVELGAWFGERAPEARRAALSVLWALYSVGLVVAGFLLPSARGRVAGLILFAVTLVKVFLVDLAEVEMPFRILSLLAVGVLLTGASYLYHRYRERIVPDEPQSAPPEGAARPPAMPAGE